MGIKSRLIGNDTPAIWEIGGQGINQPDIRERDDARSMLDQTAHWILGHRVDQCGDVSISHNLLSNRRH
jgi:hypothetical protein